MPSIYDRGTAVLLGHGAQHSLTTAVWGGGVSPYTGAWIPSTAHEQADVLNNDYAGLDREIKMVAEGKLTPQFLRAWNESLSKWLAFYADSQGTLAITPLNVDAKISQIAMYRGVLVGWRTQFEAATGKAPVTPAPVTPPSDKKKTPEDPGLLDWLLNPLSTWWGTVHIPWWVTAAGTLGVVYVGYSVYKTAGVVRKDTARLKEGAMRGAERAVEHHVAGPSTAMATTDVVSK
jgi:hypothetical protein